jgi:phage/plasmid-like protein (TIGR03299 family)
MDPTLLNVEGEPMWRAVPNECFLVRESDGNVLGRCTDQYELFQNAEAFAFLDRLSLQGDLLYHTAGSLSGGQKVWILAQSPFTMEINRKSGATNKHYAFLLCMIGHDGKSSIQLMLTDVRAECANTCGFAESRATDADVNFRIPHKGNIEAKMNLAAMALERLEVETIERRKVLQSLAQQAMNQDEMIDFATSVFLGLDGDAAAIKENVDKFYADATDRSKTIMENKVAGVTRLFSQGQGNEGDSSYDALQAFTEYFDHFDLDHIKNKIEKGKRAAKVVQSSWIGAGAERKALVYKRLRENIR